MLEYTSYWSGKLVISYFGTVPSYMGGSEPRPDSTCLTTCGIFVPGAAVDCSSTGVRERPRLPAGPSKLPVV